MSVSSMPVCYVRWIQKRQILPKQSVCLACGTDHWCMEKKKKKNEQDTSEGKFSGNTKEGEPVFIESKALA